MYSCKLTLAGWKIHHFRKAGDFSWANCYFSGRKYPKRVQFPTRRLETSRRAPDGPAFRWKPSPWVPPLALTSSAWGRTNCGWLMSCETWSYCWWFRNPARKPVEVGSLSHYLQGSFYITGGWEWDFWTINSFSESSFWLSITKLGGQIPFTQSLHSWKLTLAGWKIHHFDGIYQDKMGIFHGQTWFFSGKKYPKTGLPSRPTPSRLSLVRASTVALGACTGFNFQRLTDLGWLSWETFPTWRIIPGLVSG